MKAEGSPTGPHSEPANDSFHDLHSLQRDAERFRFLVENSRDLVIEVSCLGEMLYISPNVRSVLGYAPPELQGASVFACVHPKDLRPMEEQFLMHAGRTSARLKHKDGSWRWLEITSSEFVASDGAERRVLVAHDITAQTHATEERRRLDAELARMEKLIALGTLAGGIAHDFNNLLTGIVAYANLAQIESHQPEVSAAIAQVLKATDRARDLAQQILTFWRQQKQARQPVQLAPIVREVIALIQPTLSRAIEVSLDLHDNVGCVMADATQMHQVLLNLCQNAIHAMEARPGTLTVRLSLAVAEAETRAAVPSWPQTDTYASLEVIDTGHGMDAATQQQIFEPFFSTKTPHRGTGVGLAVVQRIIREHHGTIHVTSRPGEGTAFRILLPACPPPTNSSPAQ